MAWLHATFAPDSLLPFIECTAFRGESVLTTSSYKASELILSAVERTALDSPTPIRRSNDSQSSSFGRKSFSSMLNFSSLSLSREKSKDIPVIDDEPAKGKASSEQGKERPRALSLSRTRSRDEKDGSSRTGRTRTRSSSPFRRRKALASRDQSPAVEALKQSQSDAELSDAEDTTSVTSKRRRRSWGIGPRRSAFWKSEGSDSESSGSSSEDDTDDETVSPGRPDSADADWDGDFDAPGFSLTPNPGSSRSIDLLTEQNTEKNALLSYGPDGELLYAPEDNENELADSLGEGINVVRPEEPLFPNSPTSLGDRGRSNRGDGIGSVPGPTITIQSVIGAEASPSGSPATRRKKKSIFKNTDRLEFKTSRPAFSRDRCTVTLTHGNPEAYLRERVATGEAPREPKTYVVASDLSMESGYAVEWGIGTVLRDGDRM